jgi:hypothetical protein
MLKCFPAALKLPSSALSWGRGSEVGFSFTFISF